MIFATWSWLSLTTASKQNWIQATSQCPYSYLSICFHWFNFRMILGFPWQFLIWTSINLRSDPSMIALDINFQILNGWGRRSVKPRKTETYAKSSIRSLSQYYLLKHWKKSLHKLHHLNLRNHHQCKLKSAHLRRMWLLQMMPTKPNHLQASSSMSEWALSSIATTFMRLRCRRHGASIV